MATQGMALVHNLIAGSFTCVGGGTDNGAEQFQSCRYTPYHVPHRTEVAGFMTILHGDDRFYNNIFVQKQTSPDMAEYLNEAAKAADQVHFVCGTKPFDGYPTEEEYRARFAKYAPMDGTDRNRYYDHMPVWTGGNVFFNGAKPCDKEKDFYEDTEHTVTLSLREDGTLETNLYEFLPKMSNQMISTEVLGMAFEPEEKFENPDGSPIVFDTDYAGGHRPVNPISGPFADR
jgi:hypothetical protein